MKLTLVNANSLISNLVSNNQRPEGLFIAQYIGDSGPNEPFFADFNQDDEDEIVLCDVGGGYYYYKDEFESFEVWKVTKEA
jgi:hypothetical protein